MKYFGINLAQDVPLLYIKTEKSLLREIKEHLDKWRDKACSWIERFSIVKLSFSSNWSTDSIHSPSKQKKSSGKIAVSSKNCAGIIK